MDGLNFTKMHGLGNDFVIIDARLKLVQLDEQRVRALADRHTGVGCDQVITIEPARDSSDDAFMRIHNSDGIEVAACGNGARCVAYIIASESGQRTVRIETLSGILEAEVRDARTVTVDMGIPELNWRRIPLANEQDTLRLDITSGALCNPAAVNMGNPHAVFIVDDVELVHLEELGPGLEHHQMFPERANIGIVQIQTERRLRVRVWERGAGITRACGTGACAAAVAAHRRGLAGRKLEVVLDGGVLEVEWRSDDHVLMTGPIAVTFLGRIDGELSA